MTTGQPTQLEPELTSVLISLKDQVSQTRQWSNKIFSSVHTIKYFPETKEEMENQDPLAKDALGMLKDEISNLRTHNLLLQKVYEHLYTLIGA